MALRWSSISTLSSQLLNSVKNTLVHQCAEDRRVMWLPTKTPRLYLLTFPTPALPSSASNFDCNAWLTTGCAPDDHPSATAPLVMEGFLGDLYRSS